jgi:hypothetical protein
MYIGIQNKFNTWNQSLIIPTNTNPLEACVDNVWKERSAWNIKPHNAESSTDWRDDGLHETWQRSACANSL